MLVNKDYVQQLCIEYFGVSIEEFIDKNIQPYLDKKGKIKNGRYKLVNYFLNHSLYDMCFKAPIYLDEEKLLKMIEICSKDYIINNYTDLIEEEEFDSKDFQF